LIDLLTRCAAENRVAIRELGGIPLVIECLKSTDADTTRSAAGALINLSVNGTPGYSRSVFDAVRAHCGVCVRHAAKNKAEIRQHGGLAALLDVLEAPDIDTRRYAIRTICNMALAGACSPTLPFSIRSVR
jgi:hypothetical protein